MASYSFLAPRPTNAILSDVDHIREIQGILAQWNPSLADDAPEDSKRLVPLDSAKTQYRFERLIGSSWNSVGKLMHDVDTLDGYHASISAVQNTIPVYNADAKLVGDLTGNANTATTLKNIRKFQIGGIASGGSVNFDGSADATIEITQLTVNNANDTAINGILTLKHGGTGGADAATARANLGVPAINHASADKSFGVATTSVYGHAIGSDIINDTFTADKGYFFSPKGAYDLRAALDTELAKKLDKTQGGWVQGRVGFGINPANVESAAQLALCGRYRGFITKLLPDVEYADWNVQDANGNPIGNFRFSNSEAEIGMSISLQATGEGVSWPGAIGLVFDKATKKFSARVNSDDIMTQSSIRHNAQHIYRNESGSYIDISGGNYIDEADVTSSIRIFGPDHANGWGLGAGGISIEALNRNGKIHKLQLSPENGVTVDYNPVLTSVGGTLTGPLKPTTKEVIVRQGTDGQVCIYGAESYLKGAYLVLSGMDHADKGSCRIVTRDGTNSAELTLTSTKAMWRGQDIFTSAGGAVYGTLVFSGIECLTRSVDTGHMYICGATRYMNGASIDLCSMGHTSTPGWIRFYAADGSQRASLDVKPDGTAQLASKPLLTLVDSWNEHGSWGMVFSNGFKLQGGVSTTRTETINFRVPFTSRVFPLGSMGLSGNAEHAQECYDSLTLTSFRFLHRNEYAMWAVAGW